jgi:hypothetical protein
MMKILRIFFLFFHIGELCEAVLEAEEQMNVGSIEKSSSVFAKKIVIGSDCHYGKLSNEKCVRKA